MDEIVTAHGLLKLVAGLPTIQSGNKCYDAEGHALAHLVGLLLEKGVDRQAIIKQLEGVTCCPVWWKGKQVKSPADGIAQMLKGDESESVT